MIETQNLSKHFDDFVAVQDVSLSVQPGEVLALLGPNGAGKTTTVRVLTSILKPTSGTAYIAGFNVATQPERVRAAVGVLTENHGLYLRMNGREYLSFFGELSGIGRSLRHKRGDELAVRFGMLDALDRKISEYSKGMRQKLALIRSMLHDPKVLLLDEPTSAMDPLSARQVRDAIAELRRDGRTVMICTHNLTEAEVLADRIAIIRGGRIEALGTLTELKQKLLGLPLMELRLAQPLDGLAEDISDFVKVQSQGVDWLRFQTPEPEATNPGILKQLAVQNVPVVSLAEVPRTLEDVYLKVVSDDIPDK